MFYDKHWRELGTRWSLRDGLSLVTGIGTDHLFNIAGASVAQKMSWASRRKTTRVEDMAYSLMGIFDVNMPLLYGEGKKAFTRLQHEIVNISDDESIFAWIDGGLAESDIFARSPAAFAESGNVVQIAQSHEHYVHRAPYAVTQRGLAVELLASEDNEAASSSESDIAWLPLNCERLLKPEPGVIFFKQLVVLLERKSLDVFIRFSPWLLESLSLPSIDRCHRKLVYVRPPPAPEPRFRNFIDVLSIRRCKFSVSETYNCRLVQEYWLSNNESCSWTTLGRHQHFAALLLESVKLSGGTFSGVIVRAFRGFLSLDLIVPSNRQAFRKEMDEYCPYNIPGYSLISWKLKDNHVLSVILKRRVVHGEMEYSVELEEGIHEG